jgi:hypothetical protein
MNHPYLTRKELRQRARRVWQKQRHAVQTIYACFGFSAAVEAVASFRLSWTEYKCRAYVVAVLDRTPERRLNMLARRVADHERNGHVYRVWIQVKT